MAYVFDRDPYLVWLKLYVYILTILTFKPKTNDYVKYTLVPYLL